MPIRPSCPRDNPPPQRRASANHTTVQSGAAPRPADHDRPSTEDHNNASSVPDPISESDAEINRLAALSDAELRSAVAEHPDWKFPKKLNLVDLGPLSDEHATAIRTRLYDEWAQSCASNARAVNARAVAIDASQSPVRPSSPTPISLDVSFHLLSCFACDQDASGAANARMSEADPEINRLAALCVIAPRRDHLSGG